VLTALEIRQKVLLPRICCAGCCRMSRHVQAAARACPVRTST